jgi:hypothetical protein
MKHNEPLYQTYEQGEALKKVSHTADPIHFNQELSYRKSKYRHLSHQNGIIGTFSVRIVEAKHLKRHHWSLLGMGPVKHLGLSRAHGEVSSRAHVKLAFRSQNKKGCSTEYKDNHVPNPKYNDRNSSSNSRSDFAEDKMWYNQNSIASTVSNLNQKDMEYIHSGNQTSTRLGDSQITYGKTFKTSIIKSNSNPVWSAVQSEHNVSEFQIHLEKGQLYSDSMTIYLDIEMKEEQTAADQMVPVLKGGNDSIGCAEIHLTPLVLGSKTLPHGELDEWVDLVHYHSEGEHSPSDEKMKVRVIVSYRPNGMKPKRGDIVALESFARRPMHLCTSRPILNPFHPMRVKDVRSDYLLVNFDMIFMEPDHQNNSFQRNEKRRTGSLRLHRNTVFVIERTNLVDSALDVALKPADIVLTSSIGKGISNVAHPYIETAGDLIMPAVLGAKLMFEATKVGGSAAIVAMKSAAVTLAQTHDPENRRRARRRSFTE